MIKTNGGKVSIRGDVTEVLTDLIFIIKASREFLTEEIGEDHADKAITFCGEMAYAKDDELHEKASEIRGDSK